MWTTLQVAIPVPPTVAAGPEAAYASRLLTRFAHPLAAIIGITAMRWVGSTVNAMLDMVCTA